jgi:pyruvate kinase
MGLSSSAEICRQLALSWGINPVLNDNHIDVEEIIRSGVDKALEHGYAKIGDRIIVTTGFPMGASGGTNLIKVSIVE